MRELLQSEKPDFCLQPRFVEGVKLLAKYGFAFEICLKGDEQLRSVIGMLRILKRDGYSFDYTKSRGAWGETRLQKVLKVVLNHSGKPDIAGNDANQPQWYNLMSQLATEFPGVVCKLSGLTTEAKPMEEKSTQKYIEHAVKSFGVRNVMFGSDMPVATMGTSQLTGWMALIVAALRNADVEAGWRRAGFADLDAVVKRVFREIAEAVYGI